LHAPRYFQGAGPESVGHHQQHFSVRDLGDPAALMARPMPVYSGQGLGQSMAIEPLHTWDLTPAEAIRLQKQLAQSLETRAPLVGCKLVAGADVSYARFSSRFYAGVVVLSYPELEIIEKQGFVRDVKFPYVPGLLSFREAPVVLEAFQRLENTPDALLCDGQGLAHPRRCGLASHIGLWLRIPTVGCAKSRLLGTFKEPRRRAGCVSLLRDEEEIIGSVVRTKDVVKPLFVSVGHRIDLPSAVKLVLACTKGYRVPEPTRQAHLFVNELRRNLAC
jgi:deoxyribonuclease V